MNTGYAYIVYIISLIFCIDVNAQPFVTRIYTANNGLPDSYTLGVYQDKQGYLWIGSYTGLSRFDGQHFSTIEIKNKPVKTSANVVLQDDLNRLWVVYNKTVCLLNKDTVLTFPISEGQSMNYVFGAVQLSNKKIWALSSNGAYEFTGDRWEKIKFPGEFSDLNCRQVIEVPDGLYINFGKLIAFRKNDGSFKRITPHLTGNSFYIKIQLVDNIIYANTADGMIKIQDGVIKEIFKKQLSPTTNYTFLVDSKKRIWVSTDNAGLLVSTPPEENILEYKIALPFNLSTYLFEDRDNNIWATNYEGLIKIKEVVFTNFTKETGKLYENIRQLATDKNGDLFIASSGNGIYKIENGNNLPVPIDFSSVSQIKNEVVDGMSFDKENNLWMITRSKKLIKQNGKTSSDLSALFNTTTQGLFAISYDDNTGQMLVASDKLYTGNENGFSPWIDHSHAKQILQPRFICKRKNGNFLVITRDSGIYLINQNNEAVNVSNPLDVVVNFNEVRIFEDPSGGIWVMKPSEGITKFIEKNDGSFEKIQTITTKDGLPNNSIFSAVFDKQNKLWLTTLSGLATVTNIGNSDQPKYIVNRIGEELGSTVLNWGAANIACDNNNIIWVSTFHELIKIEANKIQPKKNRPGISIENVSLNLKEAADWKKYTDSLAGYFHIPYKPVLNYKENSLGIFFQGISFSVSPGLQYTYKLSSGDNFFEDESDSANWSEPATSNNVSFVKLPPGRYTFAVKARETGTGWSDPAYFFFTIKSPFWAHWWFRSLLIIFTALLIWWIVRMRIKRIQRKSELQRQLHELEMKALKAQMNPHFIYNALNSIQSLVADNKQQEAIKYISKFAKLLRQVLEQSGKNLVTLDKELNTLELYIQLEMLRMNMQLNYSVSFDEQILPEKEWVPPLILQPFVENALWHGLNRKEGEKKLDVTISSDDEWIFATIADNGIGRQKATELKAGNHNYPRSMGMEITGKRLQLVNHDPNTSFVINDLRDKDGNPAGTEACIKIRRQSAFANIDKS